MDADDELMIAVSEWLQWDKNVTTRREVDELVMSNNVNELRARMFGRLSFGTAGIRAKMCAGFARLNELTVIQTTQGFAAYLKQCHDAEKLANSGVVIGYDTRHNSKEFADLAAHVFVLNGIKVYLYAQTYVPTPLVPYAIIEKASVAGIMITASHNPKADNGYKAYWSNGAQIMAPHDKRICECALLCRELMDGVWDTSKLMEHELVVDLFTETPSVIDKYFSDEVNRFCYRRATNERSPLKFVYTPVHGVGQLYTPRALAAFGFSNQSLYFVDAQKDPDPEFSTAPFPNPEEGKSVLKWAIETAEKNDCSIILANDPDADRFQIAERSADGTDWCILHGNEMGSLLAWYTWIGLKQSQPDIDPSKVYYLNSAVSTKFVQTMAKKEGFNYEETLTGFKYMGNRAEALRSQGCTVPLAWEESIGYMPGTSLDKDGVLTAAMFAEMCAWLYDQGKTLSKQLFTLYNQYGYHLTCSSYFMCYETEKMKRIFDRVRYGAEGGSELKYPTKIHNCAVKYVRDLTIGYDNSQPDNKPLLPVSASSQMITFTLDTGSIVTIRGSGTEPKLKYYVELITEPGKEASDVHSVQAELQALVDAAVSLLLRPEHSGLQPRPLKDD